MSTTIGLVLAAGSGRRYGGPKALAERDGETWVEHAVRALADGGCAQVLVTVGARADEVSSVLPSGALPVRVPDHLTGMGASLRAGLAAATGLGAVRVVVMLVDLPDVGARVVERVLEQAAGHAGVLARAAYDGRPGHPVVIGSEHVAGITELAEGDAGARSYLARHDVTLIECGDLATGEDIDVPTT